MGGSKLPTLQYHLAVLTCTLSQLIFGLPLQPCSESKTPPRAMIYGGENCWAPVAPTDCYNLATGRWKEEAPCLEVRDDFPYRATCDGTLMVVVVDCGEVDGKAVRETGGNMCTREKDGSVCNDAGRRMGARNTRATSATSAGSIYGCCGMCRHGSRRFTGKPSCCIT